ncbi:MAG: hypothetical protein J5857_05875 [Treponema sp.]|nr:hypothetical protein [Treponema sp.]
MKRFHSASLFILATFSVLLFVSCVSTPIETVPDVESYSILSEKEAAAKMDFIGFKSNINLLSVMSSASTKDSFFVNLLGGEVKGNPMYVSGYEYWRDLRDSVPMKRLPYKLKDAGIATDESDLYFGDFTPQDLAVYNGKNRYVTFVDVLETNLSWSDTSSFQKTCLSTGAVTAIGGIVGCAIIFDDEFSFNNMSGGEIAGFSLSAAGLVLGTIAMIPSLFTPTTEFYARGKYAICVYDTVQKKLIKRKIVNFEQEDEFEGSFESDSTDKEIVYRYYGQCLANLLLKEYAKVRDEIENLY